MLSYQRTLQNPDAIGNTALEQYFHLNTEDAEEYTEEFKEQNPE